MSSRVEKTVAYSIIWTIFLFPVTTITGRRDSLGSRHVQTNSTELLTDIQVVLLIEHGIATHKRPLEILAVNPDSFANLKEARCPWLPHLHRS